MAAIAQADCRGMYSWWWDSHINPKNSKWLCENLKDMDVKVKQMIKIIEEDADSFAKRAEMYYKRRPELMKLVEDFYRAYRALAERYGHATGVLRHAHRTMEEAFPDKVKSMPANSCTSMNHGVDSDDFPPEMRDYHGGFSEIASLPIFNTCKGSASPLEEFMSVENKTGLEELDSLFDSLGAEKSCFYSCVDGEGVEVASSGAEQEVLYSKAVMAIEAEKKATALELEKSLERATNMEMELAQVQENCRQLEERAKEADLGFQSMKEALIKAEATRAADLLEYQKCLNETAETREQANRTENALKQDIIRVRTEKKAVALNFNRCLGIMCSLERKLQDLQENAGENEEQMFKNESQVERLNFDSDISATAGEVDLQFGNEMIGPETEEEGSHLAKKISCNLLSRLDSLVQKMQAQNVEIIEKQKELGRLWTCLQEERLRHNDVENSLQNLKNVWFQSQEESRSLSVQLQDKARLLEDAESRIKCLQEDNRKVQEETAALRMLNEASSHSLRHLEEEISSNKERLEKLEAESQQYLHHRDSLLEEVRSLQEELHLLKMKHTCILEQVCSVGINPDNLVPSIKELYAKFTEMKKMLEEVISERVALQEKSALLNEFVEKNVLLEVSILNLEKELEEFRDKVQFLEESCESLLEERPKVTYERNLLTSQVQEMVDQNKKLKEKNCCLEASLFDANLELQELRMRSKGIEDVLQKVEKDYGELQNKYSVLEMEKESIMSKIVQRQIESEIKEEHEEALEKSLDTNINDLFLRGGALDLEEKNSSLLFKFQTLVEAWKFSQVQISYLEHENLVQQSELQFLCDQIDIGKASLHAVSKAIALEESVELDHDSTRNMIQKVHDWHEAFSKIQEEKLEAVVEILVLYSLLMQVKQEAAEVAAENDSLKEKLDITEAALNMSKIENLDLKELLEKSENEVTEIKSDNDLLHCEILYEKDLLCERENRILKAEKMLKAVDGEKKEIQRKLYNLKMELANTKLAKEDQEKQISKLSEDLTRQMFESKYLREEIRKMECQLLEVRDKYGEVRRKIQTWATEVEIWEARTTAVFSELVILGLKEAMLEDKVCEVAETYEKESKSRNMEIEQLREIARSLESENVGLRSQLDAFMSEMVHLAESASALENSTSLNEVYGAKRDLIQDINGMSRVYAEQDLLLKIKSVKEAILKIQRPAAQQNHSADASTKDVRKVNKEINLRKRESGIIPVDNEKEMLADNMALLQPSPKISLTQNEIMTKDIILDQSFEFLHYADGRTLAVEADERMLELWETSDASGNIDLKVGKAPRTTELDDYNFEEAQKDHSIHDPCGVLLDEKELGVDKQEISESVAEHKQGVSKRRLLERLNGDAQKLTNLHITLNDLQRKVEFIDRTGQESGGEFEAVKAQLGEARANIVKLSDANTKLIKAVEKRFHSRAIRPTSEADDSGSFIRRRISEKARRGSEKVAKLQLEVQKLQFFLLKLGDQKENMGRARVVDRKPRVLLKDYLHSRLRSSQKQKKGQFCACVQLPNRRS